MEVQFINRHVRRFIYSLEKPAFGKVLKTLKLLEKYGYDLRMPHAKQIDSDLFELRIRDRQEVRLFYVIRSAVAIILHGFIKKTFRIPKQEIETARTRLGLFVDL